MGRPIDAFIEAKRREVDAVMEKYMSDLADALIYGTRHLHVEIPTKRHYAPMYLYRWEDSIIRQALDEAEKKMENKTTKSFYYLVNATTGYVCNNARYDFESQALAQAEKVAKDNPGHEYIVMKGISRSFVEKTPAITTRLG